MRHSSHGGRHELGQNNLVHKPTINRIARLVAATDGPILELGAGDGALTRALADYRLAGVDRDLARQADRLCVA
ncbi:MAG TPA: 23S ribosomal RNA methyltransferase Erm, partial [Actinotalea sp.]|nr:23S ribosomal RNA methyltransferase Erm [Actinotalea sp.]